MPTADPAIAATASIAKATAGTGLERRGAESAAPDAGSRGGDAAIAAALPIARSDAELAARERGLEREAFRRRRRIASTERIGEAQRKLRDPIGQRNIRSRALMQRSGPSHDAAQREADRELRSELAAAERAPQRETPGEARKIASPNAAARNRATDRQAVGRIDANADLPAKERAEEMKQAQRSFDVSDSILRQITGVEFTWPVHTPLDEQEEG